MNGSAGPTVQTGGSRPARLGWPLLGEQRDEFLDQRVRDRLLEGKFQGALAGSVTRCPLFQGFVHRWGRVEADVVLPWRGSAGAGFGRLHARWFARHFRIVRWVGHVRLTAVALVALEPLQQRS